MTIACKSPRQVDGTSSENDRARAPDVSIVIASVGGANDLDACLAGLSRQTGAVTSEILVVDRVGAEVRELVAQKYPLVRLVSVEPTCSIPELRAIGIRRSTGRIVAITEDHCVPADDWLERIVAAHHENVIAVGGSVENGRTRRLVDWAVFLCEYHRHTGLTDKRISHDLPGMNVAYKRAAFEHLQDLLDARRWEDALHERLAECGFTLSVDSSIRVSHEKSFTIRGFLRERYHYARAYAGMRVTRASAVHRVAYSVGALALPPLLLGRMATHLFGRRRHRAIFAAALPLIALFTCSWAVGESVGYLTGPGDSLAKVT